MLKQKGVVKVYYSGSSNTSSISRNNSVKAKRGSRNTIVVDTSSITHNNSVKAKRGSRCTIVVVVIRAVSATTTMLKQKGVVEVP